jgi:hypothetical protein
LSRVTQWLCHAKSLYNSERVVQEATLELWANVKQRALDQALGQINKHSDIQLELEFTGRGAYRKILSLGFRNHSEKIP